MRKKNIYKDLHLYISNRASYSVGDNGLVRIVFGLIILFLPSNVISQFRAPTHIVNIPVAYSAGVPLSFGANYSISATDTMEDCNPTDWNLYLEVEALNRLTLGMSVFTQRLTVLEFKGRLNNETPRMPVFAIGSKGIHPDKWLSPVGTGRGIGWEDDQTYGGKRNTEQYSFFLVATKDLGPYGKYTVGIGRGEFVGYGPRSHLFNSDILSAGHNNNAIGLIWGAEILLFSPVIGVFEFDGRNFNIGTKIMTHMFQIGIGAIKLEHRLGGCEALYPRFGVGLTINYSLIKRWLRQPTGELNVVVTDRNSGSPKRAVISFPGACLPPVQTNRSNGSCNVILDPGTYWVRAGIPGFFWADKEVHISPDGTTVVYFEVQPILR